MFVSRRCLEGIFSINIFALIDFFRTNLFMNPNFFLDVNFILDFNTLLPKFSWTQNVFGP